eukprot:TRINITY_DN47927_c0_g2_i1.p1 TRINITY_DN47927_c0_g2~~TRINITY_DN47927_c0_g2_i1.p1  ORF type:complete len:277 (+),score=25.77 TRINITY_DN47927_c0_g2_i1:120-950(+)
MATSRRSNTNENFRTKMCWFNDRGTCEAGDSCPFAHEAYELRQKMRPRSTEVCKHWVGGGWCRLGDRCRFSHPPVDAASDPPKNGDRETYGEADLDGVMFPSASETQVSASARRHSSTTKELADLAMRPGRLPAPPGLVLDRGYQASYRWNAEVTPGRFHARDEAKFARQGSSYGCWAAGGAFDAAGRLLAGHGGGPLSDTTTSQFTASSCADSYGSGVQSRAQLVPALSRGQRGGTHVPPEGLYNRSSEHRPLQLEVTTWADPLDPTKQIVQISL